MLQPIIENSYLVEVNLGTVASQKQINFSFIPQLEGSLIYSIQAFSNSQLITSPNGAAVVTNAGISQLTVTFTVGDNQNFYLYPVYDFISQQAAGVQRLIKPSRLNLTKSFITIQGTTGLTNNESVLFLFHYKK
jgi:hypothetical protein